MTGRRIVTAREQQEMLLPWRLAATPEEARDEGGEGYVGDHFMDSWNEDISPPADLDGPWYHSSYADLKPGDKVLPLSQNPIDQGGAPGESKYNWFDNPGMANRKNFVWMYQDPFSAHEYFQKYKRKKRNGPRGRLYVVKPDDTPQRWNNSVDNEHVSHSATVVGEIRPEALQAAMNGWLWSPEYTYKWTKAKGDNPGNLIPEMFEDIPYKLPEWSHWRNKGYDELSVEGWGGTPVEARLAMPRAAHRTAMPAVDAYDQNVSLRNRRDEQRIHPGPWYHGTDHEFKPGDMVTPHGGPSQWGPDGEDFYTNGRENRPDWVWMMPDPGRAANWGGRVYEVQPEVEGPWAWNLSPFHDDPGWFHDGYVAPRAKVIREFGPEDWAERSRKMEEEMYGSYQQQDPPAKIDS